MELKGIVEQTGSKDATTKFGVKKIYSVKIGGNWVSAGFKDPKVASGDEVKCEAETTTYGLQTKVIEILNRGVGMPLPVAAAKPTVSKQWQEKVFPVPALHGDRSIIRQNSLHRAAYLYIASRAGTKGFETGDEIVDVIIHLARRFEAYSAGDLDRAAAETEIQSGIDALNVSAKGSKLS